MSTVVTPMTSDDQASKMARPDAASLANPAEPMISEIVQLFKLLADDTRVRILYYLQQIEELNVRELCKLLHQRQPSVSHHLALLRAAGLIEMRRDGKHNFYRLVPSRLEQFIAILSSGTPGAPARVRFDGFEVRYTPHETVG